MSLVDDLFGIKARHGGHGDLEHWVLGVFDRLFGVTLTKGAASEVWLGRGGGRADIIVQEDVVIEVKTDLERELAAAEKQLADYFSARPSLAVGAATDGPHWVFYVRVGAGSRVYHELAVDPTWSDDDLRDGIFRSLQTFRMRKPSPVDAANLCGSLNITSPTFRLSTELLMSSSSHNPRFAIEKRAWRGEFRSVYPGFDAVCKKLGSDDLERGADLLYCRQTYLVVIAKLLAQLQLFGEPHLHKLIDESPGRVLDGQTLSDNGIKVSAGDDYFSWVNHPSPELERFLRELFISLLRFDFSTVDEDVFRLLYEEIIDADTRHRIGEFFTPRWLAQFIVQRVLQEGSSRFLDPACGSGTFLVEALRRKAELREKGKKLTAGDIPSLVEELWGFDINPLAVILSRVNLYLVVSRLAVKRGLPLPGTFDPSVFTADSLSPARSSRQKSALVGGTGYFVTIGRRMVPVPQSVKNLKQAIDAGYALSRVCEELLGRSRAGTDFERARDAAVGLAPKEYRQALTEVVNSLKGELVEGDGIWGLVYRNKVVPLFAQPFDVVGGNPPWLVFREMDTGMKSLIDYILDEYEVSPPAKAKTSFDLALAFTLVSSEYLRKGGSLGFVLPQGLITGLQSLSFLRSTTKGSAPLLLNEVDDLSNVTPPPFPHGVPCVAAFFSKRT